jgi:hypothetical protein
MPIEVTVTLLLAAVIILHELKSCSQVWSPGFKLYSHFKKNLFSGWGCSLVTYARPWVQSQAPKKVLMFLIEFMG